MDMENDLHLLTKKFGKPCAVIFVWQDDAKKTRIAYSVTKMKLRVLLPAIFNALSDLIKKAK